MLIKFVVNPIYIGGKEGWSPTDTRLGGTEESVVEWSKRMVKLGHEVRVFYNGPPTTWEGVSYLPYDSYCGGGIDINIKYHDFVHQAPVWYLTNEVDINQLDLSRFDGVILPSKWSLDNLGTKHSNISIVPHGYDPELIYPDTKIANQCIYTSSPDRGLENLVKLWPQVVEQVPDAELVVTYGGQLDTPNTTCLGEIDDDFMSELYRTSNFWLHPCTGYELYCISAIKAQVALTIPVYFPVWALQETVTWGARTTMDTFVDRLVALMKSPSNQQEIINHRPKDIYPDWDYSTDVLLRTIGAKQY